MKKNKIQSKPLTISDWLLANQKQNFERKIRMEKKVLELGEIMVGELVKLSLEREIYETHGNGD